MEQDEQLSNGNPHHPTVTNGNKKTVSFNFLLTNARSLAPKINSLQTYFDELDISIACVTESWLKDGQMLDRDIIDLEHGTGLKILYRNRPRRQASARAVGGGVSIIYNKSRCSFRERKIASSKFELVVAVGRVAGVPRDVAVFALYIEPKMKVADLGELRTLISDQVLQLKASTKGKSPIFLVAGDVNRRDIAPAFSDFVDIERKNFAPTRGDACLDIIFSNANMSSCSVFPPLATNAGTQSDHACVVAKIEEETVRDYVYVKKLVRKHASEAVAEYGRRLADADWLSIIGNGSVEDKVAAYEKYVCALVDELFPLRSIRCRNNERPWITNGIRRLSAAKKRVFRREGKSRFWMRLQEESDARIEASKQKYVTKMMASGQRAYFTAVKQLNCKEKPKAWDVTNLYPNTPMAEVGDKVAEFFTQISDNFEPLPSGQNAEAFPPWEPVTEELVAKKIRAAKKPNSAVAGDILPRLLKKHAALLARPATMLFNAVFESGTWPASWKGETTVVIPKNSNPSSLSECRNISCTNFLSKVLESIVLDDLRREIPTDPCQYGGLKGASVDHLLVDAWEAILSALDNNNHSILMSIDFEKAFNRLDHRACMSELRKLGASPQTLGLVQAFLTGRTMRVKLPDGSLSNPRALSGGSPQGSVLGCMLYCLTTQHLNKTAAIRPARPAAAPDGLEHQAAPPRPTPPRQAAPEAAMTPPSPTDGFNLLPPSPPLELSNESDSPAPILHDLIEALVADIEFFKYVDDSTSIQAASSSTSIKHFTTGVTLEEVDAGPSRDLLQGIINKAREIGMAVNCSKTQMLCVSTDNGCDTFAEVTVENNHIRSAKTIKLLGFHFSSNAGMQDQVLEIKKRFRGRFWSLVHLHQAGLRGRQLFNIYSVFVRPVIELNSVIYHPMITKQQAAEIEMLQKRVTRLCFGFDRSYTEACTYNNIDTLERRRKKAVDKFTRKTINNPRFAEKWLIPRPEIENNLRRRRPYIEKKARTTRYYNSPLLNIQRTANNIA